MHIPERPRGRCTLPPLNEKYFLSVWIIILKCIQKLYIMACIAVKYSRANWLYIAVYTWHHLRANILEAKEAKFFCTLSLSHDRAHPKNKIKCCPSPSSGTEGSAHWRQMPLYTMKWHFTCSLIGERGPQLINKVVRCYLHKGINSATWYKIMELSIIEDCYPPFYLSYVH